MKVWLAVAGFTRITTPAVPSPSEAPTGFDDKSNGAVNDSIHQADRAKFDEVEAISDGLGPLYNAQSCRECHQNPTSGGASQITELRVGHLGPDRRFRNAVIPIARGKDTISGRTLVNDRAICPNSIFPDSEIQERVPENETIRTLRASVNLLGDGLVEAVDDTTLISISRNQCRATHGQICGQAIHGPHHRSPGGNARGEVRLEGPARQPAVLLGRRLLERDGDHVPAVPRRADRDLQHRLRAHRQTGFHRALASRPIRPFATGPPSSPPALPPPRLSRD